MKILAVSGSLRAGSKNTTALLAAAHVASAEIEVRLYQGLGELPHFNPDLDDLDHGLAPAAVLELRRRLRDADALLICSPEYAHGVAGAMKNALDWVVGSGELTDKPTLVMNLSPGSQHAHPALLETLRVMGAAVLERTIAAPISGRELSAEQLLALPAASALVHGALADLVAAVADQATG